MTLSDIFYGLAVVMAALAGLVVSIGWRRS